MHRIDGPGHNANHWTQGDPVTGVEPTEVTADFMEAVQEEIGAVIEGTGAALNKADNTQLFSAVTGGLINPWANRLLNTQFEFWQRFGDGPWTGTPVNHDASVDALELIGPDRWFVNSGDNLGDADFTREEFALGTVPIGMEAQGQPSYYLRWNQTVGATALKPFVMQRLEGVRTFAGSKVSVSFVARVTASTEDVELGLTQHFGTSGTPSASASLLGTAHTVTTTWTRFTSTFTLAALTSLTIGTDDNDHLAVEILRAVATTGTLEITDVRITPGIATNNTLLRPSWIDFLGCLRYYQKTYLLDTVPGVNNFPGSRYGFCAFVDGTPGDVVGSNVTFITQMRVPCTIGPAQLTRGTNDVGGMQRIWRSGGSPTLGECDWPPGTGQTCTMSQATRHSAAGLVIADSDLTSTDVYHFQADFDAEIWIKA